MPSRRSFLLGSFSWTCGTLYLADRMLLPAWAKKTPRTPALTGPHVLSREDWPPAIVPDHVGLADKGYLCFTDEFGRLAVVDMRKPTQANPFKLIAEINSLGNKVADFAVNAGGAMAYGLTYRENDQQEAVVNLVSISLNPINSPSITSDVRLERFTEAGCLTTYGDMVVISGRSNSGENLVSIYGAPGRRWGKEPSYQASLSTQMAVRALELTEKQLTVLSSDGQKSQVDFIQLSNPTSPEIQKSITMDGDYRVLSRFKELVLIAGNDAAKAKNKQAKAKIILAGSNPHAAESITLEPITQVESAAGQKERFLLLGNNKGDRHLISLAVDKNGSLLREQVLAMPQSKNGTSRSSVVMKDNCAYVAAGWAGVQQLTKARDGWTITSSYSIPRLAAAGVATWGDLVVLAGAELQLYNVSRPERPMLMGSAEPQTAVKAIVGAGSFVLCLSKDELSLRSMRAIENVVTNIKLQAGQICFDKGQQKAYAIKSLEKTTRVTAVQVYKDSLMPAKALEVPGIFGRCQAADGSLALCGLNDAAVYSTTGSDPQAAPTLVGSRHFENLALRDLALVGNHLLATAIDTNSKGFFLVLDKSDKDLKVLGSIDLPHDALAIAGQSDRAIAIGRGADGSDVATILNFSNPVSPLIVATLRVIEGASSVTIKDQLAVLGGRGLEIITLS